MNKKLKIQFWKAEKALAMQILEQEGLPKRKNEGNVRVWNYLALFKEAIVLGGINKFDLDIPHIILDTNAERDEYLQKAVNAITEELFAGEKELKIGEVCAISDDPQFLDCYTGKLIAILPEGLKNRYIIKSAWDTDGWICGEYARMLNKTERPTIEECGNVITYTWEEK